MGCRILKQSEGMACFYDSVTNRVFGLVATVKELEDFRDWIGCDPRAVPDLEEKWYKFLEEEE